MIARLQLELVEVYPEGADGAAAVRQRDAGPQARTVESALSHRPVTEATHGASVDAFTSTLIH